MMDRLFDGRRQVLAKLPHTVEALEKPLQEAIRAAHIAAGIAPVDFVRGMDFLGKGFTLDPDGDPYSQLSLQTCLKYLCCGGLRIVGETESGREYATDQDAFFRFFDIEYRYDAAPKRPCGRVLQAGTFGSAALWLHRIATVTDSNDPYSPYSPRGLDGKVRALMDVLRPLCDTRWGYQAACQVLMAQLVQDHLVAMDAENEAQCCYRKAVALCRERGLHMFPSQEAMALFHRASVLGHAEATLLIGLRALELGQWYDGDEPAYAILQEAAKLGCPGAELLAEAFIPHYPSEESFDWTGLIQKLLPRAARLTVEKYALGLCYLQRARCGGAPVEDTQQAKYWLQRAVMEDSRAAGALLVQLG